MKRKNEISEIPQEEIIETEEGVEVPQECHMCTEMYRPAFAITVRDENSNLQNGGNQAAYLLGFAGVLNNLGLSEASIVTLIEKKMYHESQMEMLRMQLESNERVAGIMSKTPIRIEED